MKPTWYVTILCLILIVALEACGEDAVVDPTGPFALTFEGDASFQGPHGGQTITVALVKVDDGTVVQRQTATVSATADPAFSFSFPDLLEASSAYEVHYWIDSNFGGGTAGACDPKAIDHQWNVAVAAPTEDVVVTESHNPAGTTDVCGSFAATLTFGGDASFQGPHGNQTISAALVRADNGTVVARQSGTVSASADPAFSFSFANAMVDGVDYQVHYWIDSNFGGGTAGFCDPKAIDHQWNVSVPAASEDVTVTESHNPAATADVCSSFTASLTFDGDASFQGAHGGHDISVAVVRAADGAVVARQTATVSASGTTAFSFSFTGALVVGVAYQLHYWIDSNFGGGTAGFCDPKSIDHQWNVAVPAVSGDVAVTEAHAPAATADVCPSFAASLTFAGDASFQGAHGGQDISVAVVRSTDGAVVALQNGTVSASANPAFSFSFTGALVVGVAYEVHYWIDSNFGGGTVGVCDAPNIDHQWSTAVATVAADVSITEQHTPSAVTDVCASFP